MIKQDLLDLQVPTRGRGFYEITDAVGSLLTSARIGCGLMTLQLLHTSASLLIQENADPEVRRDLERFFSRLVPDGDPIFRHVCEGSDDMPAHVRTALTTVNMSLPVRDSRLCLGTWQGIFLWEHRATPHNRQLVIHLLGDSNGV